MNSMTHSMTHSSLSQEVQQPKKFVDMDVDLYPHQITSICDLEKLESTKKIKINNREEIDTSIGIFGDIPGYGKTISMIATIVRDKMEWNTNEMYEHEMIEEVCNIHSLYTLKRKEQIRRIKANLIVVSTSIIGQWVKELSRSKLNFCAVSRKSDMEHIVPEEYDVVLCSSTQYNDFVEKHNNVAWKRFIYDEATSTHISSMKPVKAGFFWFITATYQALRRMRGSTHFIKTIFGYMSSLVYDSIIIKNDDEYVKQSFTMPTPIVFRHRCLNPGVLGVLSNMITNDVTEMISAGNIQGAIRHLGGSETDKNIVDVVSKKIKEELEEAKFKAEKHLKNKDKDHVHKERYEKWVQRVESLSLQLKNIKERFDTILEEPCPICQSDMNEPVMVPCCQNIYCGNCLLSWMKQRPSCPLCRQHIQASDLTYLKKKKKIKIVIDDEEEKDEDDVVEIVRDRDTNKTKPETVLEIVQNSPNGKFLIFSSHDESFELVKPLFLEHNIDFVEIKGTRESREKKLDMYRNGEVNIIFLNSKFNGAGINLQNTSDIILYHAMNEYIEKQVIGRANRIGRTTSLNLHYLQ